MYLSRFTPFDSLHERIDDLLDNVLTGGSPRRQGTAASGAPATRATTWGSWMPAVDVSETDKELVIKAEIPGVDPKDIEISVAGRVLTVRGEKKEETEEKGRNFHRTERRFGSFQRSIELPETVDVSKIQAKPENGVVTVTVAKNEKVAPRRIPIN